MIDRVKGPCYAKSLFVYLSFDNLVLSHRHLLLKYCLDRHTF